MESCIEVCEVQLLVSNGDYLVMLNLKPVVTLPDFISVVRGEQSVSIVNDGQD